MTIINLHVRLEITRSSYDGETAQTFDVGDAIECVRAGLYQTYANPARSDAGISKVLGVREIGSPVGSEWFGGSVENDPLRRKGDTIRATTDPEKLTDIKLGDYDSVDLRGIPTSLGFGSMITPSDWKEFIEALKPSISSWSRLSAEEIYNKLTDEKVEEAIASEGMNFPKLPDLIAKISQHYITEALDITDGNKSKAAKLLGLPSYQTLTNWMDKYLPKEEDDT